MIDLILQHIDQEFSKVLTHLKNEFAQLQIGRASSALVENLDIEAYGSVQNLRSISSISVPDAKTIQIQPWDKQMLQAIEKAISTSGLGLNPNNDGIVIRLNIPALTEERRRDLTKLVNKISEDSKIAVRNLRHEAMEKFKSAHKNSEITEDQEKLAEKKLQEKVDHINKEIETMAKGKEKDILTI